MPKPSDKPTPNKPLHLFYKCRMCGTVFNEAYVLVASKPSATVKMLQAVQGRREEEEFPELMDIHDCGDGNMGVADLIGANMTGNMP